MTAWPSQNGQRQQFDISLDLLLIPNLVPATFFLLFSYITFFPFFF
jgi:hypothetical protein